MAENVDAVTGIVEQERGGNSSDLQDFVMPRRIVVATDLSDLERLLPYLLSQAKASGAQVSLVHAVDSAEGFLASDRPRGNVLGDVESRCLAALHETVERLRQEGVACEAIVKHGVPAEVVQHEIERTGATRLLIGTHGHRHVAQNIIGSVANALLRSVAVPVFVVGPYLGSAAQHTYPRHILHPVSLAGRYKESAAFALKLAQAYSADLTFVHVIDASIMHGSYVKEIFEKARHELDELIPKSEPPTVAHAMVEAGEPILNVLELSVALHTDWIVVGIEHNFPWWSMRNNAAYLMIAEAQCPVLTFQNSILADVAAQPTVGSVSRYSGEE